MTVADLHPLLLRQLRRVGVRDPGEPPSREAWEELIDRVGRAYAAADQDRYTLERSLDLSSSEMTALHQRIAAERDRSRAVVDALSEAVLEVDGRGIIRSANPAAIRMLGGDPVGRPGDDLRLGGAGNEDEDGTACCGGREFPAAWQVYPLADGARLVTVRDLTARKQAEAVLRDAQVAARVAGEAEKAKDEFLAGMSHELRTPLNAILGYCDLLREEAADLDLASFSRDLDRISTAGRHLLGLINDILDLSKVAAGKMELSEENVEIRLLVSHLLDTCQPLALRNGNRVGFSLDPALPMLYTDPTRLSQILLNLIGNACKFTSGGRIDLDVRAEGAWAAFEVRDTGVGMDAEQISRLFQPFSQAERDTARRYGGTGLGLALSAKFAALLGGGIEVRSEIGVGSRFILRLPLR